MDLGASPTLDVRGVAVPRLLYGTAWKEDDTARLVGLALEAGFRGIDTANQRRHYHEAGVGEGIAPFLAAQGRDALFLQSKYTYARGQDHRLPYDPAAPPPEQVHQSMRSSLEHLGVLWLDALILHGPERSDVLTATDRAVWRAMEEEQQAGRTRLLGVSNVRAEQLRALLDTASVPPSFVQNRCYASQGWDASVREICRENGIVYQGFSLLTANRSVWNDRRLYPVARRLGATPAQVILRFAWHLGILPLTGTTDPAHMKMDLEIGRLALGADEIALIEGLGRS